MQTKRQWRPNVTDPPNHEAKPHRRTGTKPLVSSPPWETKKTEKRWKRQKLNSFATGSPYKEEDCLVDHSLNLPW